ncbi:3-keto-5-aminohexanoate cleavage protein [Bradyrhizobium centrolobii]|uniref:3-keto-5-aminohexanoate cleavage protein n=1 Tax=Bradyrhizobium centrolobii TaxID=1505087 RepID=UPI001FD9C369|nr:3-keto-5-aminohexanoate cleavage protein [Bradyrhizobium centrolobii]
MARCTIVIEIETPRDLTQRRCQSPENENAASLPERWIVKVCASRSTYVGDGGSVWPCVREAWRLNLSTRIGFEDGIHLPNDTVAPDNAELVRAAIQLRG